MDRDLAFLLGQHRGGPIEYSGKRVVMAFEKEVLKNQEVQIEIMYYDLIQQGIAILVDNWNGAIDFQSKYYTHPVFWMPSPCIIEFTCKIRNEKGKLAIWNVWECPYYQNTDAWIGNAGMSIDQVDDNIYIAHCSNGIGEVNFENLIFKIAFK